MVQTPPPGRLSDISVHISSPHKSQTQHLHPSLCRGACSLKSTTHSKLKSAFLKVLLVLALPSSHKLIKARYVNSTKNYVGAYVA